MHAYVCAQDAYTCICILAYACVCMHVHAYACMCAEREKHIDIYNAAGIEQKHIDIYNAAGIELAKGEPAEGPVGILVSGRLVVETYICWLVVKIQKPRFLRSFKIILGTFGPRAIFLKITLWPFGPRAIFLELSWGPLGTGPCFDL